MTIRTQQGSVYGVILNDQASIAALGDQLNEAPYKAPNKAPVLYVKPRNTQVASGSTVTLPNEAEAVEVGATIGLVIGQPTSRVSVDDATSHIAGLVAVADLSLPHSSYYRPAIREKCFDGACPMAGDMVSLANAGDLAALEIKTFVNGEQVASRSFGDWVRSVPVLLQDVSEFMSLNEGDVLLTGVQYQAPQAKAGDQVKVEITNVGSVEFTVAAGA